MDRARLKATPLTLLILLTLLMGSITLPFRNVQAATLPFACAPATGTGTITGTVTAAGGGPLQYVYVTAYTALGQYVVNAATNALGVYEIKNLVAGAYILEFKPNSGNVKTEWSGNQPTALTATTVLVTDGGTTSNVNAALDPGGQFVGLVQGPGGLSVVENALVLVYDSTGDTVASGYTNAAGNFITQPGLANGAYRIRFFQTGAYLADYYNNKPTLGEAAILTISGPGIVPNINTRLALGASITGKVTDAVTGLPVVNYAISAYGAQGSGYDYTDVTGSYEVNGLPSGTYQLEGRFDTGMSSYINVTRTVTVAAPNPTANVNFALKQGGRLQGHVTSGGVPLENSTVFISNDLGTYQEYVNTDATGLYEATGLPSGQYTVYFRPNKHIAEIYNNRPFDEAGPVDLVSVTAPDTVSGIDADLAVGGIISGKVVDAETGLPIQGVGVEIFDAHGSRAAYQTTRADGTYKTESILRSGDYRVQFLASNSQRICGYISEFYNNSTSKAAATVVSVSAPGIVTNIDGSLARGSLISGKVTDAATGAPISSGRVIVYSLDGTRVASGSLGILGGYVTSAVPTGSYRVLFSDSDGGYIDEYYDDKLTSAAATPLVVTAPTDLNTINASLATGGRISGRVTRGDNGQPFTHGYVVVLQTDGTEVATGSLNEDGTYLVREGLATGNYYVGVVPFEGMELLMARAMQPAQGFPGAVAPFSTSYYRGTGSFGSRASVSVTAPNTTSNIDIQMGHTILIPRIQR